MKKFFDAKDIAFWPFMIWNGGALSQKTVISLILNGYCPVSMNMENKEITAHGVKFSPFGLAHHDLLHSIFISTDISVRQYAMNCLENSFANAKNIDKEFRTKVFEVALRKHTEINKIFQNIFNNLKDDKIVTSAMFIGFHENPGWNTNLYHITDAKEFIQSFVDNAKYPVDSFSLLEAIPTNVNDGSLVDDLLDADIDARLRKVFSLKDEVSKTKIKKIGDMYIEVKHIQRNGEEKLYYIPTLKREFDNSEDTRKILSYVGVPGYQENPVFDGEDANQKAITYLKRLDKSLNNLMDDFKNKALSYVDLEKLKNLEAAMLTLIGGETSKHWHQIQIEKALKDINKAKESIAAAQKNFDNKIVEILS